MTPRLSKKAILAEAARQSRETGHPLEVDHAIPVRGKVKRGSQDWVLICGLGIPSNWQIVPKEINRKKWMHFSSEESRHEEMRLMRLAGQSFTQRGRTG